MSKSASTPATFMKFLPPRSPALPSAPARRAMNALLRAAIVGGLVMLCLRPVVRADTDPAAPSEETLARYPWPDALKDTLANPPFAGHAALVDAPADAAGITGKVLRINANKTEPLSLRLLTLPNPPVGADFYAVAGQVKYEGMDRVGYLEMWSTFPPNAPGGQERSFFSRTLGETTGDAMDGFRGTSTWRPVILPFNAAGAGARPTSLLVNLILPAGVTVYLAPMRLAQYHYGAGRTAAPTAVNAAGWPGWKLPAAVAAVFLAIISGWMIWRTVGRRRAAEWRRMAAHDASTP